MDSNKIEAKNKIVDFEKCSSCVWIWETPEEEATCRLHKDVSSCLGPNVIKLNEYNIIKITKYENK
jgi:hypothetical protein